MRKIVLVLSLLVLLTLISTNLNAVIETFQVSTSSRYINSVQTSSQITSDEFGASYVCYINSNLEAVAAKTDSLGDSWNETVIGYSGLSDAHLTCAIGIDPDGYVWIIWKTYLSSDWSGRVLRSTVPNAIFSFTPDTIDGAQPQAISYPTFITAGENLYLFFRDGSSGFGDTWLKKWTSGGVWVDIAAPLFVRGNFVTGYDSSYLGNVYGSSNGDLHIVWTARVGGWNNRGVFYTKYQASNGKFYNSRGEMHTLPIDRFQAENVLDDSLTDMSLSNTGLSITLTSTDLWVGYNKETSRGNREVWIARKSIVCLLCGWYRFQLSNTRKPMIRVCTPPDPSLPSPCDLEMQGPQLISDSNTVMAVWVEATKLGFGGYGRPPGIIKAMSTSNLGLTWEEFVFPNDVNRLGGEMGRDNRNNDLLLFQETYYQDSPISVLDLRDLLDLPALIFSVQTNARSVNYLTYPDSPGWAHPGSFSLLARYDARVNRPMTVLSKQDEIEVVIASNTAYTYDPGNVLVRIGNFTWNPDVSIPRDSMVDLAVTLSTAGELKVYVNGALIAQTTFSGSFPDTASSVHIGHHSTLTSLDFEGRLSIKYYQGTLTEEQVNLLVEYGD